MITALNRKWQRIHIPCIFTVNSAFVTLNVIVGQYLVGNSTSNKLAHQLQNKHKKVKCTQNVNKLHSTVLNTALFERNLSLRLLLFSLVSLHHVHLFIVRKSKVANVERRRKSRASCSWMTHNKALFCTETFQECSAEGFSSEIH